METGLRPPWVTWPGWAPGEQDSHALILLTSVLGPLCTPHAHPSCRKWQIRMEIRADTQPFQKDLSINVSACSVTQSCLALCGPPGPSVHGFSRQEYGSVSACPPPGDLPDPGIEPASLATCASAGGFFTTVLRGKPHIYTCN